MSSGNEFNDEISVEALRAGDSQEFARLVDATSGMIYRLAIKMLGDPQDAEDVLQDTFVKVLNNIHRFDGRSRVSTWLYRIAANEALMLLRKRKRAEFSIENPADDPDEPQEPLQIVDWCCMPEEEMMSSEARRYLDRAVNELSPSLRVVFLLREIEGLSTQETAEVLDLSETAVKTRLSRARLRLRELLTSYYGDRLLEGER